MDSRILFEEKIISFATLFLSLLVLFLMVATIIFLEQTPSDSLTNRQMPVWFFALMFFLLVFLVFNFCVLNIKITTNDLTVRYGFFRRRLTWDQIEKVDRDEGSLFRYAGWGIRLAKVKGKWRVVYNVLCSPRVVLTLKNNRIHEFVFSTHHPDEVIRLIRQQTGLSP